MKIITRLLHGSMAGYDVYEDAEIAPRRYWWCTKCERRTWHARLGDAWVCLEPQHHNGRWRKVGDALAYLEREEGG